MPVVNYRFVGDSSSFTRAAKQVNKGLAGLGQKMKASFSPANMLGPLAAAASFQAIASAVVDATKVYFEDQRSLALLNKVIDNNTEATGAQKAAIDASVQSMSMMSATSDDELRQSLSTLVAGTKDTTEAQKLLAIALDTSKATGKNLNTVSIALSKAYNGNYTALKKLLPGVTASSKAFDELKQAYGGAAAEAGANDPFGKLAVAAEQLQEIAGAEFAPYLQEFIAWFSSTEGKQAIADFKSAVTDLTAGFKVIYDFWHDYIWSWAQYMPNLYSVIGFIGDVFGGATDKVGTGMSNTLDEFLAQGGKLDKVKDLLKGDGLTGKVTIADRIKMAAKDIKAAGEKWKNSLSFAEDMSDDKKFFNAENFQRKMREVVAAAKALPAKLKELRKAGASPEMLQQVIAMGPQEGLAVAEGFIRTGGAKEYSKSIATLSSLGQQSQANIAGQKTYTINVNKANMTADEIIAAIQKYEGKTGRKVAFGG